MERKKWISRLAGDHGERERESESESEGLYCLVFSYIGPFNSQPREFVGFVAFL